MTLIPHTKKNPEFNQKVSESTELNHEFPNFQETLANNRK